MGVGRIAQTGKKKRLTFLNFRVFEQFSLGLGQRAREPESQRAREPESQRAREPKCREKTAENASMPAADSQQETSQNQLGVVAEHNMPTC